MDEDVYREALERAKAQYEVLKQKIKENDERKAEVEREIKLLRILIINLSSLVGEEVPDIVKQVK